MRTFLLPSGDDTIPYFLVDRLIGELRSEAEDYLSKVQSKLQDESRQVMAMVEEGDPARQILDHAAGPGTLIAISTHGHSGILRIALGSVATKVIMAAAGPVLIVRPRRPGDGNEADLTDVFVPLDGSPAAEQALPHAIAIAKALSIKVTLIRVVPPPPLIDLVLAKESEARATNYLSDVTTMVQAQGIPGVRVQVFAGDPAAALLGLIQSSPGTLIAMTTHGRSGLQRWILGSVADRIVRESYHPVLLVRARQSEE